MRVEPGSAWHCFPSTQCESLLCTRPFRILIFFPCSDSSVLSWRNKKTCLSNSQIDCGWVFFSSPGSFKRPWKNRLRTAVALSVLKWLPLSVMIRGELSSCAPKGSDSSSLSPSGPLIDLKGRHGRVGGRVACF